MFGTRSRNCLLEGAKSVVRTKQCSVRSGRKLPMYMGLFMYMGQSLSGRNEGNLTLRGSILMSVPSTWFGGQK